MTTGGKSSEPPSTGWAAIRPRRLGRAAGWAVLLALLWAGAALANAITINTDDGLDDPHWTATPFRADAAGDGDHGYDIHNFWIGADAFPPNLFFFRVELDAPLPVESYVEARLDCNMNGDYFDASDVLVMYMPSSSSISDVVYVTQGNSNGVDFYRPDFGEATHTSGAYEWKAPTTGTNTDWTACTGEQVAVILATVSYPLILDEDLTEERIFGAPTAVRLLELTAKPTSPGVHWAYPVILLLAGIGLAAGRRRMRVRR